MLFIREKGALRRMVTLTRFSDRFLLVQSEAVNALVQIYQTGQLSICVEIECF